MLKHLLNEARDLALVKGYAADKYERMQGSYTHMHAATINVQPLERLHEIRGSSCNLDYFICGHFADALIQSAV